MDLDINAVLFSVPESDSNLMGTFTATDVDVEPLCVCKTIYFPDSFLGFLLEKVLMPVEAWTHIHGAITDGVQDMDCRSIINCLCIALTK